MAPPRRLIATPLQVWERDGVAAALAKAGLPADDIADPYVLLWRFETYEDIPVGFGGLEIYDYDALLHSVVTLPSLRHVGMGAAIVAALEAEARARRCRAIYLVTGSEADFFTRLGYAACACNDVPEAVRASRQFTASALANATLMRKGL
jgi:N-acetylglutamate synthase-like GNAT family acetyltransferase